MPDSCFLYDIQTGGLTGWDILVMNFENAINKIDELKAIVDDQNKQIIGLMNMVNASHYNLTAQIHREFHREMIGDCNRRIITSGYAINPGTGALSSRTLQLQDSYDGTINVNSCTETAGETDQNHVTVTCDSKRVPGFGFDEIAKRRVSDNKVLYQWLVGMLGVAEIGNVIDSTDGLDTATYQIISEASTAYPYNIAQNVNTILTTWEGAQSSGMTNLNSTSSVKISTIGSMSLTKKDIWATSERTMELFWRQIGFWGEPDGYDDRLHYEQLENWADGTRQVLVLNDRWGFKSMFGGGRDPEEFPETSWFLWGWWGWKPYVKGWLTELLYSGLARMENEQST